MFGNSSHEAKILILIRCIISLKRENLKFGQMLLSLMLPLKLHLLRRRVFVQDISSCHRSGLSKK